MSVTALEVKTFFETLIDDSWDEDSTYSQMQNEQEKLEMERDWMILRTLDVSLSVDTGTTWETEKTLPTNFLSARKVYIGTADGITLTEIAFDMIIAYKDIPGYYAIDHVNKKIRFTGTFNQTYTVYLFYKKSVIGSSAVDENTVFPWQGQTGLILAYRMAQFSKAGVDGDTVNFQMSPEQSRQYKEMKNALIQWDTSLQLKSLGN